MRIVERDCGIQNTCIGGGGGAYSHRLRTESRFAGTGLPNVAAIVSSQVQYSTVRVQTPDVLELIGLFLALGNNKPFLEQLGRCMYDRPSGRGCASR
jgi:hypothetical protein